MSSISVEECRDNGFTSNLMCSSCDDLRQYNLTPLIEPCQQCCNKDEVGGSNFVSTVFLLSTTVSMPFTVMHCTVKI